MAHIILCSQFKGALNTLYMLIYEQHSLLWYLYNVVCFLNWEVITQMSCSQ